jgi:uncharacterized protein YdbL (DUF1318 family)
MESTRLKGVVVRELHQALVEVAGDAAARAAVSELSAADRREYEEALALSWVRITVIEQVLHAAARHVERDVAALNRDVNRITADRSVRSVLRLLLKFASPETVIPRVTGAYGRAYDRGRITARMEGEGRGAVELRGRPGMSVLAREGFAITLEMVLRHTGASNVRVASVGHVDGADYTITWRP